MSAAPETWLDRAIGFWSPQRQLRRLRARSATDVMRRHYEAAGHGRRTQGWRKSLSDANAAVGMAGATLRHVARDLVRNNPYAESALSTIVDHTVGWGIAAKPKDGNARAKAIWDQWAGTTACDADGLNDFAGLQKLVIRTVAQSGECLIRKRPRLMDDGLPIALQIQVLEPDYLDTLKTVDRLQNGGRIINGIELDAIGRRAAYWLFPEHPGAERAVVNASVRVPADLVRHVFRPDRPGGLRGVTWFAPVLLRFKDFDEFEDATLMKQKIAACLAVITTDVDGSAPALGTVDSTNPLIDQLEPGAILNVPVGRQVEVVQPPSVREYDGYTATTLRGIAAGLGVTYEDMTGDYQQLPFSAARMSRLRHWARVEDWRWRLVIPQFCDPVWRWAMEAAAIGQHGVPGIGTIPEARWSAPPPPLIDPGAEGLALQRLVRSGFLTLSEAIRERGYDPDELFAEMAEDNKKLDALGLVLDSDPRRMSQAGQAQGSQGRKPEEAAA